MFATTHLKMNKINILIVDDFMSNRLLIIDLLEDIENLQTFESKNGLEAIELIKKNKIDVVFLDIEMPVMNGFETAWHIRNDLQLNTKSIKVIALTAHPYEYVRENECFCFFDGVINKPYTMDKIHEILNKL